MLNFEFLTPRRLHLLPISSMKPDRTMWLPRSGGLGIAAVSYVAVDYLRHLSPTWHRRLMPILWLLLAVVSVSRVPFYKHWTSEFRSLKAFLYSMLFMLLTLLAEAAAVRFVTVVPGLDWHTETHPLPDTGQWFLLAQNEKLPNVLVEILRARIVGLHHFLMLFMILAFSVLFGSVKAPGLGLGARYMLTMAIGRILRSVTFVSTIVPSPRPWCAGVRFGGYSYPHHWAQKYYVPYASDSDAIRKVLQQDMAFADTGEIISGYRPDWGPMSFLIDILRPTPSSGLWYNLLRSAGGGCNDLVYSGHVLVAVLTAMAWTEAYGGFSSGFIWLLVLHSAQREIRERHHYSVDVVVAIYAGILIWKMTSFLWSAYDTSTSKRVNVLEKIHSRLTQAAKDGNIDEVRELLREVELVSLEDHKAPSKNMHLLGSVIVISAIIIVLLALVLTSDG